MELKQNICLPSSRFFADSSLPLAIVVTRTSWEEPPRIRHQVTRQLLRFFNVVYIQKDLKNRHDKIIKISDRQIILVIGIGRFFSIRLYANFPVYHYIINERFVHKIDKFIKPYAEQQKILVNFDFDFYQIMKRKYYDTKIYICYDELPKMRRTRAKVNACKARFQAWLYQRYENSVAKNSNRCLASHEVLRRKLKKVNSRTQLFLHGHEFNDLRCKKKITKTIPMKIGFMGYITYNLLVEWLLEIVKTEDMRLYLIGPIEEFDMTEFSSYRNFKHIPPLTGKKLFKTLTDMDVLIMPYDTEMPQYKIQTASNKFFQYLAAGKPVVISNMKYYIKMPYGVIYRADNPTDFVDKIRTAFDEDCMGYKNLRLKIASENTWRKRGDQLFKLICKDVPALKVSKLNN